jgi:hypothetical protein
MTTEQLMTISTSDPIIRARSVYDNEKCARSFDEDLYLHLNTPGCIVYKDDTNLALLRPVNRYDSYEILTNPARYSTPPNAWWLYLLVGDFRFLCTRLPYVLPFIGWERHNVPRFHNFNKLLRCLTLPSA